MVSAVFFIRLRDEALLFVCSGACYKLVSVRSQARSLQQTKKVFTDL